MWLPRFEIKKSWLIPFEKLMTFPESFGLNWACSKNHLSLRSWNPVIFSGKLKRFCRILTFTNHLGRMEFQIKSWKMGTSLAETFFTHLAFLEPFHRLGRLHIYSPNPEINDFSNLAIYKPIAISSTSSKVIKTIITNHVMSYLELKIFVFDK